MRQRQAEERPIPMQYVPKRIATLASVGEYSRELVYAAAMFCYFEHHQWLLRANVGSNFPRGYKVQSSLRFKMPGVNLTQRKPEKEDHLVLTWGLIECVSFQQIALRAGYVGAARTMHRTGKGVLRKSLEKFASNFTQLTRVAI